MTKDQAKRLAEVATWIADGKQVQFKHEDWSTWQNINDASFHLYSDYIYRLKPEPREWWLVNIYHHTNLKDAEMWARFHNQPIIHVREVV